MLIPTRRLTRLAVALAAVSFALLVLPPLATPLLALDAALLFVALADALATPAARRVSARRDSPERVSLLHPEPVRVTVTNDARTDVRFRLRDTLPPGCVADRTDHRGLAPGGGSLVLAVTLTARKRGRHLWGDLYLRLRSPLGFWERPVRVPAAAPLRVYPSVADIERYHLLAQRDRLAALGIRRIKHRGAAMEFESLREYATGDDTRQMDWKATARRGRLVVRNREAERNQSVVVLVDCGRLMQAEEGGVAKLDHAINATLLLSHVALARGDRVGLLTFADAPLAWLPARGNVGQARLISEALYDAPGSFRESDHGRALRHLRSRHGKRSLLVVLTDFVDTATAKEMVAHLQLAARRHLVVFVALRDTFLGKAAASDPVTGREAYRKAAALDLLRERRDVMDRLRQLGVFTIDCEPREMGPPLINRYLEVAYRGLL